nr:2K protein [Powassan virus]
SGEDNRLAFLLIGLGSVVGLVAA